MPAATVGPTAAAVALVAAAVAALALHAAGNLRAGCNQSDRRGAPACSRALCSVGERGAWDRAPSAVFVGRRCAVPLGPSQLTYPFQRARIHTHARTAQSTATVYANKAAFVTNQYTTAHYDASLAGPASGYSATDGAGGYWSCLSTCSTYCPQIQLGYVGTTAAWYSVVTFPVVVRQGCADRRSRPGPITTSKRTRMDGADQCAHAQAAASAPRFCASSINIVTTIDTSATGCLTGTGTPTGTQPTWANVKHIFTPVKNTWYCHSRARPASHACRASDRTSSCEAAYCLDAGCTHAGRHRRSRSATRARSSSARRPPSPSRLCPVSAGACMRPPAANTLGALDAPCARLAT